MWVLKIDVQGGEVDVLRGAKRLLAERRVSWIYPEFDVMALHVLRSSAADLLNLLEAHDFSCVNSRQPMQTSATTKVAFPPKKRVGGMQAKSSFHGKER